VPGQCCAKADGAMIALGHRRGEGDDTFYKLSLSCLFDVIEKTLMCGILTVENLPVKRFLTLFVKIVKRRYEMIHTGIHRYLMIISRSTEVEMRKPIHKTLMLKNAL